MGSFINRDTQLELIDDAFAALLDNTRLLRTPFIDFYGVKGIGKTTLLKKIEQKCKDQNVSYIWVNASQDIASFSMEIANQIRTKYQQELQSNVANWQSQPISATRGLLERGPVVMLLDAVDPTNTEQVRWLEVMLRDLLEEHKLFVVVTSKKMLFFEREVARKLTPIPVEQFTHKSCDLYIESISSRIEAEMRSIIFEWTRGYPLAIDVMVKAIQNEKLDPRRPQDQRRLLAIIIEQIIDHGILAKVEQTERDWLRSFLTLFSVPRRSTLLIMQEIIEVFAPELRLERNLTYFRLPKLVGETTGVLNWFHPGFSVMSPVRHLLLLKQRIENFERYIAIHSFLRHMNKRFAGEVSGSDRIRYLHEYLYHSAHADDMHVFSSNLEQTLQECLLESPEFFIQFSERFLQDEALREELSNVPNGVLAFMHRQLAETCKKFAQGYSSTERLPAWRNFLYHIALNPETANISSTVKRHIEAIIQAEPSHVSLKLLEELSLDERFQRTWEQDIDAFILLIRQKSLPEDQQLC